MDFLRFIEIYPQFVQYIIDNDIAPFNEIIQLAQSIASSVYLNSKS